MGLPFTSDEFLGVFARYNEAVAPLQLVLYAVALLLVVLTMRAGRWADQWISALLAALWAWMAIVYHWGFFVAINEAAYLFGGLFLVQALLFAATGAFGRRLSFRFTRDAFGYTGVALIAYALLVYPLLGVLAGHAFPRGPTFGLPCPTTIFTFGLLLNARGPVPFWVMVIPAAWSVVGSTAAFRLGIIEDLGLLAAGVVGTMLILWKNHRIRLQASEGVASP